MSRHHPHFGSQTNRLAGMVKKHCVLRPSDGDAGMSGLLASRSGGLRSAMPMRSQWVEKFASYWPRMGRRFGDHLSLGRTLRRLFTSLPFDVSGERSVWHVRPLPPAPFSAPPSLIPRRYWRWLERIGLIGPISDLIPMLLPVIQPCSGHVFAKPAFFEEIFFQAADLLIEKIVRLMNQADGDVG